MHWINGINVTQDWQPRYLLGQKTLQLKLALSLLAAKKEVLSQGFNGFPRGIDDSDERYNNRDTKYKLVVHAEMNAIYNATYSGTSLDGATLYVYGLPICSECAKGIIQVGIKKVVVEKSKELDNWNESVQLSKVMFDEAGVELIITNKN